MVSEYLGEAGFRVAVAAEGRAGLERLRREPYDALVLDLMLPDMDGLEVCRQLRATSSTPVLMLTARGDAMDRVVGLEVGADDYLPKPFEPRELLARLLASLAAFALASGLLWRQLGDAGPAGHAFEVAGTLAQNVLPPAPAPKAEQQAALEKLAGNLRADVALFAADRTPLAAVGAPLSAPDPGRDRGGWLRHWGGPPAGAI